MKSVVRVLRNELAVGAGDERRTISGFDCLRRRVTWVLETEDPATGERTGNTMTADFWMAPETAETRALRDGERQFQRAYLAKLGVDAATEGIRRLGIAAAAGLLGIDEAILRGGFEEMERKLSAGGGYPIVTAVTWTLRTAAGNPEGEAVFDSRTEVTRISTPSLAPGDFAVPAGYRPVRLGAGRPE